MTIDIWIYSTLMMWISFFAQLNKKCVQMEYLTSVYFPDAELMLQKRVIRYLIFKFRKFRNSRNSKVFSRWILSSILNTIREILIIEVIYKLKVHLTWNLKAIINCWTFLCYGMKWLSKTYNFISKHTQYQIIDIFIENTSQIFQYENHV